MPETIDLTWDPNDFKDFLLTDKGVRLLSKIQIGETLNISRVSAGIGVINDFSDMDKSSYISYVRTLNDLHEYACDISVISNTLQDNGTSVLTAVLSNKDKTEALFLHEVGIFATDPDEGEVLYAYSYSDLPVYLPRFSGFEAARIQWNLITAIGNAENVNVTIEKIELDVNELNKYIHNLEINYQAQLEGINRNFDLLNGKVETLEEQIDSIENQTGLTDRVSVLESLVEDLAISMDLLDDHFIENFDDILNIEYSKGTYDEVNKVLIY